MTILFGRVWIPLVAILYVAFAALQVHPKSVPALAMLLLSPLLIHLVWRRTAESDRRSISTDTSTSLATRAAFSGAMLWLAARAGPTGHSSFDAAANLGTATCTLGALVALARIAAPGGLLVPAKMTRSLDAAVFAGFLWSVATTLPIIRATVQNSVLRVDPITVDYATIAASFSSILLIVAVVVRLRFTRRYELGVADRCNGALSTAAASLLFAVPAALLDIGAPDRSVPAVLIAMALIQCWIATTPDATRIVRWLRGSIATLALGAPVTLLAFIVLRSNFGYAGWIISIVTAWSIAVGIIARTAAKPLEPEQSRWLTAIEQASQAALQPEPSDALRAALSELSRLSTNSKSRSELWNIDPAEVRYVDVAGQLHERSASLPESLTDLAAAEPEQTLRLEVLRAVQVRRADVRPLVSWFENQGAFCATLMQAETGPLGVLCLPSSGRRSPLALEEAQALKRLGVRVGALLSVSAAQARSRQRELNATNRCAEVEGRLEQLEREVSLELDGHRQVPIALARSIRGSCYAPQARISLEQVERLAKSSLNQALVMAFGGDDRGWAAVAHTASPRMNGPLIIVDPVNVADYPKPWLMHGSHSKLLAGGNVVLIDPLVMDFETQQAVSNWLAASAAEPQQSVGCILIVRSPLSTLVANRRIHEALARRFVSAETQIPTLAERGDDLRALVLDKVARLGMSLYGEPRAVDSAVLAELLNYAWPGNESELDTVLLLLVQKSVAQLITLDVLEQANFYGLLKQDQSGTPLPSMTTGRPPKRVIGQRPR